MPPGFVGATPGIGYFLTARDPRLPQERAVLSSPAVSGHYQRVDCGFIAFLGDNELTIECFSYGTDEIPANFRELPIEISSEELLP